MGGKKITNMEVKRKNRNEVFRYIRSHGIVSNPDISYALKMSLPTVTQFTKELIEKGLVEERGELQSTGGRRAKALRAVMDVRQAVGLDITKNHINLVLTDLRGEILQYKRICCPYASEDAYYRGANEELECFLEESGADREKLLGIGISFPGIIDLDREVVAYSHILGVSELPVASMARFFSRPCSFLNDANAGAYAEGVGTKDRFFYLSLSNTVGGAVFAQGELVQGRSFRCGEAGHMTIVPDGRPCYCGKRGCLDAYCAAGILSGLAGGRLEGFFAALEEREDQAVQVWEQYTDHLSIAVNNIHMLLDCEIVLGGYVGSYAGPYLQELWDKISERNTFGEQTPFVRACRHQKGAAALGAALYIMETFVSQI